MSTRILKDNRLWGLISCHHREPYFLNFDECLVFELLSGIISAKLTSLEIKESSDQISGSQSLQAKIMEDIYSEKTLQSGVKKSFAELMKIFSCTGMAYSVNNSVSTYGDCPDEDELDELVNWLQVKDLKQPLLTHNLNSVYDRGEKISDKASGLLILPVIPDQGEFIIGFRSEVPQQINWGGNPNEAIQFEEDKKTYHPRNSFKLWKQAVKNHSLPFTNFEKNLSNDFHRMFLDRRLNEKSKRSN